MLTLLNPNDDADAFPPVTNALEEPNGLLAIGGDLSPERLRAAYQRGIFPWFNAGEPILWWSPDPRAILLPENLKISRSLRQSLRNRGYSVSFDQAFAEVMRGCAAPRADQEGTWIIEPMHQAYADLHAQGIAHSVEVWRDEQLVGGLYGINLGRAFFGESMFSTERDASKVALVHLVQQLAPRGLAFIDCQLPSPHLASLGSMDISRDEFLLHLESALERPLQGDDCWPSRC